MLDQINFLLDWLEATTGQAYPKQAHAALALTAGHSTKACRHARALFAVRPVR